jgi:hypothetical protein
VAFTKGGRTRLAVAALGILATSLGVSSARAAPMRAFKTPAGPLTRVLLDFAVQADISIGADAAARCPRPSPGVAGRFTVAQALDRLLAGTGCGYRMVDATTVQIVRERPAEPPLGPARVAPAPPRSPAPAEPSLTRSVLPEVVVTATRRSALAIRLPDSIGVISGARMATDRDTSLGDLAGQAAGLTVTNLGPGVDKTIIRGLSDGGLTGHTQSTVGIYLDDTRLTCNAPDPDLRLADVDQVEVLQGPQGAVMPGLRLGQTIGLSPGAGLGGGGLGGQGLDSRIGLGPRRLGGQGLLAQPRRLARRGLDLGLDRVGQLVAVRAEQLDAVVDIGVVRCRDHHAQVGAQGAGHHGDARGRHGPQQAHVHSDAGETGHQGRLDHVAGQARILADHNQMAAIVRRAEQLSRRQADPQGDLGRHRVEIRLTADAVGAEIGSFAHRVGDPFQETF